MAKQSTGPILLIPAGGDFADLTWRTGFKPVDPVVLLDTGRTTTLVVPLLELGRAGQEAAKSTVVTPQDLGLAPEKRRSLSSWALAVLRKNKIRRVRIPRFFPAGIMLELQKEGIEFDLISGALYPARAIKTPPEIEAIRSSQQAAVAGVKAGITVLRAATVKRGGLLHWKGKVLTSERLRTEIDHELLNYSCIARDTIVAGGRQATDPHDRGSGPLRAGEAIVLDIFPQSKITGYWGDITRTVIKGVPPENLAKLYNAVLSAQHLALKAIRPGVLTSSIHKQVQQFFEHKGFVTEVRRGVATGFFHGTGHGVGLDIHESPSISTLDEPLRAGHVVTVEPGLYYPDLGGVRIEDTVVVTADGCRILAPCPKPFQVL